MKREKKKGSCLKTVVVAFGVIVILGAIGSVSGSKEEKSSDSNLQNDALAENESIADTENVSDKEVSDGESLLIAPSDEVAESDQKEEEPLGFNVMFSKTYRNDVTGNWRLARIAENINIEEYALEYYKNYFESDNEIHIIINFTLNTTTRITVMGNLLDVSIMEYVDKEEHDAKLACSGMLLSEYYINIETGEIENIQ